MTRRLRRCLACAPTERNGDRFYIPRGFTRHADQICSWCRARGVRMEGDQVLVPLVVRKPSLRLLLDPPFDPVRPTLDELRRGRDLTGMLANGGMVRGRRSRR